MLIGYDEVSFEREQLMQPTDARKAVRPELEVRLGSKLPDVGFQSVPLVRTS